MESLRPSITLVCTSDNEDAAAAINAFQAAKTRADQEAAAEAVAEYGLAVQNRKKKVSFRKMISGVDDVTINVE